MPRYQMFAKFPKQVLAVQGRTPQMFVSLLKMGEEFKVPICHRVIT